MYEVLPKLHVFYRDSTKSHSLPVEYGVGIANFCSPCSVAIISSWHHRFIDNPYYLRWRKKYIDISQDKDLIREWMAIYGDAWNNCGNKG